MPPSQWSLPTSSSAVRTPSVLSRSTPQACDRVLDEFFESARQRAASLSPQYVKLWSEIERASTGGKRIRPALVGLSHGAYADTEGVVSSVMAPVTSVEVSEHMVATVGVAFELLHTALIVHDDVIDRDLTRRHQDTLHVAARRRAEQAGASSADAAHYGTSVGVVAGDLALSGAYRVVATSGLPPAVLLRVLDLLDGAVFASGAGELMDVDHALPGARPTAEDVLRSTRLKTSVYSFEAPLQAGAVLAGAPEQDVDVLGRVGQDLGLAFQLADDLLGVFGRSENTGKATDADLLEGKHTPLVSEALKTGEAGQVLELLGGAEPAPQRVARLRQLFESTGARKRVEERAQRAADDALAIARDSALPASLVEDLGAVARGAVERLR